MYLDKALIHASVNKLFCCIDICNIFQMIKLDVFSDDPSVDLFHSLEGLQWPSMMNIKYSFTPFYT